MVGVGVAEGGGGPPDQYYGEYYPQEQYYVQQEICPHPQQHPQHTHMCTVQLPEYGGVPVVTSATMMPSMMPPVIDENMRHYLVHPHQAHPHHTHHQPHHQPQHHQPPPHHQPPHHYGPTNGAGGPQHYYGGGYPHFHVPQHHMQHSPPPPVYQNERAQRVYSKLKQKLERKQHTTRNNGTAEANSGASTPSLSPRKELNGRGGGSGGASSGAWSEGEGSSAGASLHGDDDDHACHELLAAATRTPQVSDITPTSALVQWNSPLPEGVTLPNAEVTYELLLGDRGRFKAIYSGASLSCRVRDLRPGCEYSVCLQIRAGEVTGPASEVATFRAPPAPPDAPPAPRVAQRLRSSVLLRWAAAADNGARVSHYTLEMDAGEGFAELTRPRTKQHTANNLRAQTRYRFRVAAVNECGRGAWSEETVVWTAGAPPAAPAPPSLTAASPDTLALAWERRADEEFTLQMDDAARGHGFLPVYAGADTTHTCARLRRATDYRFRLRCETADGQGPWSAEVTYRTAAERPGPPGRPLPRGKVHSRAFRLRWEPPAEDGGAPVDSYTLELDAGEGYRQAYRGPEREAHCDRLRPGTPYRARVRATSAVGESDWSPAETVATEPAPPAACPAPEPAAAPRPTLLSVRWRAPDCTGGAPLSEYRVEVADAAGAVRLAYTGAAAECLVRDLLPGRDYRLWVTAHNAVGAGPASPPLEFSTPAAPPDAPAPPVASTEGPRAARLEWTPPADNGAPILDYRLEMSASGENAYAEVYRGADAACVIGSLAPFSPYFFRVCARNAAGRGVFSGAREVLTERAPPGPPLGLRHEATAESLRLQWRAAAPHGAAALLYRVQVDGASLEPDAPALERLVEGLAPDTVYRVRVAALSDLGLGEWSEEAHAATRPPPPAPPALVIAPPAHNHLRLEWAGGEGAHYCVEMRAVDAREFRAIYRGSARSCKAKKLRENTEYQFRIRASDERGGRGAWSAAESARTAAAPPPAPRAPSVALCAPRRADLVWDPVDDAEYVLQCARLKDAVYKQVYAGAAARCALEELEAGAEYLVRVCAVRGGLAGAWSAAARLCVPPPAAPRRAPRAPRPQPLQPRHLALLIAAAFVLLAVLVAVLLERVFVDPQP